MSEKKVLITGGTGFLGRAVMQAFSRAGWHVVGTGFSRAEPPKYRKLDLLDKEAVESCLNEVRPQVVVHCAADRSPDSVSRNPDAARALNVTSTAHLSTLTFSLEILLLYISTDDVFPGSPGAAPYSASSSTSPPNLYGQTKLDGERAVLAATSEHSGWGVALRVPVLYGHSEPRENWGESAVNTLVSAVWKAQEEGAKVAMDDWAVRYPTCTEDVGRVCEKISTVYLERLGKGEKLPAILQFSSEDRYTKYEICQVLAEILGLPLDGMVANKEGNDPKSEVQRPYDTHLSTKELMELGIQVGTCDFVGWWRRELKAFRH
ncbi:MAG: hypothetical protein Q9227_003912 [Pyrenula ochraceoflavens]